VDIRKAVTVATPTAFGNAAIDRDAIDERGAFAERRDTPGTARAFS
jgi:hypothetical protein